MISIVGTAIVMAALAGMLGFSVAIGAFFAGLVFSRDPKAVKVDTAFESLYDLFVPFFFIHIGLSMSGGIAVDILFVGLILTLFAVAGKLAGAGMSARLFTGWRGTLLLGLSLVPRAEISMIITQKGLSLGDWAMLHELFGGMIVVSMLSCLVLPVLLRRLLLRWDVAQ
jgi:Kef-type K+ transport system membrane component KefB